MPKEPPRSERPFCFVIMSFGNHPTLQDHYELAIKPTVESYNLDCLRADEVEHNGKITGKIISLIRNASFIIADLTEERPNCYYELGYVHALNKVVIHTLNKKSALHFDVKDYNFILYERVQELSERLAKRIESTVTADSKSPLGIVIAAIAKYRDFEAAMRMRMVDDRVTEFPVQSYRDQQQLPKPFNHPLEFHVKDGLLSCGNQTEFDEKDGSFYVLRPKKRGGGWPPKITPDFEGLVERSTDICALIEKIDAAYVTYKSAATPPPEN